MSPIDRRCSLCCDFAADPACDMCRKYNAEQKQAFASFQPSYEDFPPSETSAIDGTMIEANFAKVDQAEELDHHAQVSPHMETSSSTSERTSGALFPCSNTFESERPLKRLKAYYEDSRFTEAKEADDFLLTENQKVPHTPVRVIRAEGGFKCSEATLRGRYRNIRLPKDKRPREPHWTDEDASLLRDIVEQHDPSQKIVWTIVGTKIAEHNGGLPFSGRATAAKYREIASTPSEGTEEQL